MTAAPAIPLHDRELLTQQEVYRVLGLGRSKWFQARKAELVPFPVMVSGAPMWRRRELADWVDAGCPPAADWKWSPTVPVTIDEALRVKSAALARLQREIAELEERSAAGERLCHVVRRRR